MPTKVNFAKSSNIMVANSFSCILYRVSYNALTIFKSAVITIQADQMSILALKLFWGPFVHK